ncbi:MAG TPA: hypothetical protein VFW40_10245, partial [Capsulimonadaceae bacterium]|nr:hypothetical protein [Capsulimonadaceae bacterium]
MKRLKMKRIALGTALAATLSVAIAIPVLAQGGPPPGPGGFGGPGGPGGPGGRPLALGAVQSVDTSARTITLSDPRGGSHTIRVASDAKIVGDKAISVSDLNVGDKIQVRGRPSVITADSIFAGGPGADMPPAGPPAGAQGPGAFGPPPGGPQGFGPGPDFGPPGGPGRIGNPNGIVVETGTVTKLNPLTISFGGGRTLTVELSPSAKVHTAGAMKLSDIKKGDRV